MYLINNLLSGQIPASLADIPGLVELGLQDNNFGGAIPEDIFMIETLEILTLANNNLTSIIPANVGDMASLILLSLARNSLTGAIPTSISTLGSLEILDLSENQLSGAIPAIGGLTELRKWPLFATISHTRLHKCLTPCLIAGQLILLENLLTGNLPSSIVSLANLEILDLHQNELEGSFPEGFTVLDNLRILDLSLNFFTGTLPDSLGDMTSLVEVRLNNNAAGAATTFGFSGPIPPTVGFLDRLIRFELSANLLTGTLPSTLGFLDNLQILDVSQNPSLGGPVPSDFQNLVALKEFLITGTSITGEIPAGLCLADLYLEITCGGEDAVSCSCCVCSEL